MNTKLFIALILAGLMMIWTGRTFFTTMDGDILWKKLAAGSAFLLFAIFFVLTALKTLKANKLQKNSK